MGISLHSAHRLADRLASVMGRIPRLYSDGFGDRGQLEQIADWIWDFGQCEPDPIEIRWSGPSHPDGSHTVRSGAFESPVPEWVLPAESRLGHVQLLMPDGATTDTPVCLHLASTGEQGFAVRSFFAAPLLRRGIGALLLENPFYGLRRPAGQFRCSLRTVRDQFAMNYTTVVEARSLLAWLRRQGHGQIGVTGYSQGGVMSAFAAALTAFPVAAVPRGAATAAGPIFLEGGLSKSMNWPKLSQELGAEARSYFARCLEPVNVSRFPPPVDPTLAILVNARHDAFVPPEDAVALHRHWPGSELRWLEGGHVTAALHIGAQRRAVLDAFSRLASKLR